MPASLKLGVYAAIGLARKCLAVAGTIDPSQSTKF